MHEFAETFLPPIVPMLEYYQRRRPIFDLHGIEDDISKALDRKISLKSGGYLIFDQTEAMTTIDVNTGGYVGHRNLEETIYRTNLEAAVAVARQLRLRNIGGLVVVDFIDMRHRRDQQDHQGELVTGGISEKVAVIPVDMTPPVPPSGVTAVRTGVGIKIFWDRSDESDIAGNIYKGRVQRVLPGMQAAFVDIGLERAAFLHASDIAVSVDNEKIEPSGGEDNITVIVVRVTSANGRPANRLLGRIVGIPAWIATLFGGKNRS